MLRDKKDANMNALGLLRFRLLEIRATRGQSAALARLAGVDPSTVSGWIAGKFPPCFDKLDAIAAVRGLTLAEFFLPPGQAASPPTTRKGRRHDSPAAAQSRRSLIVKQALQKAFIEIALNATEHLDAPSRAQVFAGIVSTLDRNTRSQSGPRGIHRSSDSDPARQRRKRSA
jgi:transcriptional regulator with XRE-family HTH domain